MHCLLRLRTTRDCAWEDRYHRKLRGRFSRALQDSPHDQLHDAEHTSPFTFSEPMPYAHEFGRGDEVYLLLASQHDGVLKTIVEDLQARPKLLAGSFQFEVRQATPIVPDVGAPGASGTITSSSGIIMTLPNDGDHKTDKVFWGDENTKREFIAALNLNICDDETAAVFDSYEHSKTYALEVDVTPTYSLTVIASKWDFAYTVRDEKHRETLNRALRSGVGSKRSFGFGCLQTREKRRQEA